jgi:hypothetical protein
LATCHAFWRGLLQFADEESIGTESQEHIAVSEEVEAVGRKYAKLQHHAPQHLEDHNQHQVLEHHEQQQQQSQISRSRQQQQKDKRHKHKPPSQLQRLADRAEAQKAEKEHENQQVCSLAWLATPGDLVVFWIGSNRFVSGASLSRYKCVK